MVWVESLETFDSRLEPLRRGKVRELIPRCLESGTIMLKEGYRCLRVVPISSTAFSRIERRAKQVDGSAIVARIRSHLPFVPLEATRGF
ncbi:hypothetical protein C7435_1034 [Maricaulis maris]|uniref:Uncharacterized protein n=1 Tax=Maricaulis maris TaxID=74318 RepID=A0A495DMY1_9PROT|nr:hypothetical protein C7435_1034 [Maricaulis maris]